MFPTATMKNLLLQASKQWGRISQDGHDRSQNQLFLPLRSSTLWLDKYECSSFYRGWIMNSAQLEVLGTWTHTHTHSQHSHTLRLTASLPLDMGFYASTSSSAGANHPSRSPVEPTQHIILVCQQLASPQGGKDVFILPSPPRQIQFTHTTGCCWPQRLAFGLWPNIQWNLRTVDEATKLYIFIYLFILCPPVTLHYLEYHLTVTWHRLQIQSAVSVSIDWR